MPDCAWEEPRDVCFSIRPDMFDAHQYLRLEASREVPMPYELENRLVIGVASSAVFDLLASDAVFQSQGRRNTASFSKKSSRPAS